MHKTLHLIGVALENPAYNFIIHTTPFDESGTCPHYHWHIEIMPKLTKVAGFEWGTGFYINPTPPEAAARFLEEAAETNGESHPDAGLVTSRMGVLH